MREYCQVNFCAYITRELHEKLIDVAEKTGLAKSFHVREALKRYLTDVRVEGVKGVQ
ncbi:MAG: ribbon-helix-helix domain-containing protein [Phycisphaerae bacterium]|nr:ribbon-helix-helix domain-containing protein [Phycisphaerae bacterium]